MADTTPTTPGTQDAVPAATPTRKAPRIAVQSASRIVGDGKAAINRSMILNVSLGGALLFTHGTQKEGESIHIELGQPIFPIPRQVRGRVAHVADAPEEILTLLRDKGYADKKKKGYLLGIEFTHVEREDRQTLEHFIRQKVREEQQRRAEERGDGERPRSARDRLMRTEGLRTPRWAYLLGALAGMFVLATGIAQGDDELTVALHVGIALAAFWVLGRIAATIWDQLDASAPPDATIIAHTDKPITDVDEALADADSMLDLPPEEEENGPAPDPSPSADGEGRSDLAA
jgi:hypothetical protein